MNDGSDRSHNDNSRGGPPSFARGRPNPTSSFTRPKPSGSFQQKTRDGKPFGKPRPTNSFNRNQNRDPNGSFNASNKKENYKRANSRLTVYDVELYVQGDGYNRAQKNVIRVHADTFLQARLLYMDPPTFDGESDNWNPHHKCLWNDPSRREQIEQVMMQYPNAIPLSMKKRTRIRSSKLGDTAAATASDSITMDSNSEPDDSSVGTSVRSSNEMEKDASFIFAAAGQQEDNNPLRKTLLLLNKLSWTTIDKLTQTLYEVLEQDVPKLTATAAAAAANNSNTPPSSINTGPEGGGGETKYDTPENEDDNNGNQTKNGQDSSNPAAATTKGPPPPLATTSEELCPVTQTILCLVVEKAQQEPHFSAMYAQLCKNLADRNKFWKRKMLAVCQTEFERDIAWHIQKLDEALQNPSSTASPMQDGSSNTITSTTGGDENDREYQIMQLRKRYLGHVQFIGELFKLGLIKLDIMIWCLSRLLFNKDQNQADEDDLECFAKLMTTVGAQADSLVKRGKCHAVAEEKWYQCWDRVHFLTGRNNTKRKNSKPTTTGAEGGSEESAALAAAEQSQAVPPKISSRIKFMLVDLLELEENGAFALCIAVCLVYCNVVVCDEIVSALILQCVLTVFLLLWF
jgi:hypothetical protein